MDNNYWTAFISDADKTIILQDNFIRKSIEELARTSHRNFCIAVEAPKIIENLSKQDDVDYTEWTIVTNNSVGDVEIAEIDSLSKSIGYFKYKSINRYIDTLNRINSPEDIFALVKKWKSSNEV